MSNLSFKTRLCLTISSVVAIARTFVSLGIVFGLVSSCAVREFAGQSRNSDQKSAVGAGEKSESRCGWVDNPTPGNFTLTDANGAWMLATQGGYQVKGLENIPDFGNKWIRTNGWYGYGCGCIVGVTDPEEKKFVQVTKATVSDIKVCTEDKRVPRRALPAATVYSKTLCGWIDNPTPGNWWLSDNAKLWKIKESWTIAVQGAHSAAGTEKIPDFKKEWVKTNGNYGYGCACIDAETHDKSKSVYQIHSAEVKPLKHCEADPNLPKRLTAKPVKQKLCGWIDNPTPGNWWLTDSRDIWTISVQGGFRANGTTLPDFGSNWKKTNGSYGYGCGCIDAVVDQTSATVSSISAVTVKALSACTQDTKLLKR